MKKILVIGSMNMDFVAGVSHIPTLGETVLADNFELVPGGKGANQSYAIGKMHGNVAMLGMVGQDTYGERLCENLKSVGVDVTRVRKLSGVSTGIAVIGVIPEGDNSILVIPGANAYVDKSYVMENMDLFESSDIIVVQLEIPLETVMYVVKEARKRGKTVILDPAPAISDLPDELFSCVDVIKPNETELAILVQDFSSEENLCANAELLQRKGVKNIVVTLGGEGSYLLKEDHTEKRLYADKTVHVVDTTAAGDSYVAGLAVALSRGDSLDEAVELASRVSNIVVTSKALRLQFLLLKNLQKCLNSD